MGGMKSLFICLSAGWALFAASADRSTANEKRTPVIVELFTSEGCSSCPPADALLSRLANGQPVPGVEIIALGEHVDYWNHIGWQDPFSSSAFSKRQGEYARIFGSGRVYTPQMVVDGQVEFVGSDASRALAAIAGAARASKASLEVVDASNLEGTPAGAVTLELRATGVPAISKRDTLEIFVGIAEGALESSVSRGENAGRKLKHDAVVRKLSIIGRVSASQAEPITSRHTIALENHWRRGNLRVIIFLQERNSRRILGATAVSLN